MPATALDLVPDILAERNRIPKRRELPHIKGHLDNLRRLYTVVEQIIPKQPEQEKALSAPPNAGYYLDEAVVPSFDKSLQVSVPFDCHVRCSMFISFNMLRSFNMAYYTTRRLPLQPREPSTAAPTS